MLVVWEICWILAHILEGGHHFRILKIKKRVSSWARMREFLTIQRAWWSKKTHNPGSLSILDSKLRLWHNLRHGQHLVPTWKASNNSGSLRSSFKFGVSVPENFKNTTGVLEHYINSLKWVIELPWSTLHISICQRTRGWNLEQWHEGN